MPKPPERLFLDPKKADLQIEAIYAWVCVEPAGGEGIPAAHIAGYPMPLIGADLERMRSLRPYAEQLRRTTGYPVRLIRFGVREVLEELP